MDSTCFAIGENLKFLALLLNSPLGKYLLKDSPKTGTGDLLISVQAIEPLLIPRLTNEDSRLFEKLYDSYTNYSADERIDFESVINDNLLDLFNFTQEEKSYILSF